MHRKVWEEHLCQAVRQLQQFHSHSLPDSAHVALRNLLVFVWDTSLEDNELALKELVLCKEDSLVVGADAFVVNIAYWLRTIFSY